MKKILSVFLATILLLSCLSVGLTSFAATINYTGDDLNALIDMIDKKTATLTTNEKDENGNITHYVPGYTLNRVVKNNATVVNTDSCMKDLFDEFLPEYSENFDRTGTLNPDALIADVTGFAGATGTVTKSVEGSSYFGKDALKNMKLDANTISAAKCVTTATKSTFTVNFNNFTYSPDVNDPTSIGLNDSALPDLMDVYMPADTFTGIIDKLKASSSVQINDAYCNVSNIKLEMAFNENSTDPSADKVNTITITYTVNALVDIYYMHEPITLQLSNATVTTTYSSFVVFNQGTDIDYNELASSINSATAYVVDNKAGYDFEKISKYAEGTTPTLTFSGTILGALSGFINPEEKFKELVDKTIDIGLTSETIKPTTVAADKIGNYAVSETCVSPQDFAAATYNSATKTFTINLNNEVNPSRDTSKLAKLTKNFVSQEELRNKFKINFTDKAGISLVADTDECKISYSNIKVYVSFSNATDDNPYGDGKISSYCVKYDYSVSATIGKINANIAADMRMLTDETNFEYVTYEVGDVDQSGKVSIADVKSLLQGISGAVTLTDTQKSLADISGDGKMSIVDAKLLLDYIANTTV